MTFYYDVTYDLAILSSASALGNNLTDEFVWIKDQISHSSKSFGSYDIDHPSTSEVMSQDIETGSIYDCIIQLNT